MEGTLTYINERSGRPEVGECIFDLESKLLVMELMSQPLPLCLLLDAPEAHMIRLAITGDVSFAIDIKQTCDTSSSKDDQVVKSHMFMTRTTEELDKWFNELKKVALPDCKIIKDPVELQKISSVESETKQQNRRKKSGITVSPPPNPKEKSTKAMMKRVGSSGFTSDDQGEEQAVDDYLCGLNSKRGSILKPNEREILGQNMRVIRRLSESGGAAPFLKRGSLGTEPLVPIEATTVHTDITKIQEKEKEGKGADDTAVESKKPEIKQ